MSSFRAVELDGSISVSSPNFASKIKWIIKSGEMEFN